MYSTYAQQQQQAEQTFWLFLIGAWIVIAVFCAIIGSIIGDTKGKRQEGALLGLFLGVIGVIAIAVMKDDRAPSARGIPSPAGWHPDPYGVHQLRWFDGTAWREMVSDAGTQSIDPPPPPRPFQGGPDDEPPAPRV